jgi:hypothetical protein
VAGLAEGLEAGRAVEGGGEGDEAGAEATEEVLEKSLDARGLQVGDSCQGDASGVHI